MDKIENDLFIFWKEDGILYQKFKKNLNMTLPIQTDWINLRHDISNGEHQYYCSDISLIKTYNKEARDYAEKYGQDFLHGAAIIVNSHVTKFIFNTFALTKKVTVPFRAFKTKEAAVKWLLEIKKQNEASINNHEGNQK